MTALEEAMRGLSLALNSPVNPTPETAIVWLVDEPPTRMVRATYHRRLCTGNCATAGCVVLHDMEVGDGKDRLGNPRWRDPQTRKEWRRVAGLLKDSLIEGDVIGPIDHEGGTDGHDAL